MTVPSSGIAPGASSASKVSWRLPAAQFSNVTVSFGGKTYATTYDHPRGVTVVSPGPGTDPGTDPTTGPPGACSGAAWSPQTAYNGGARVSHDGHYWTARYWTQGEAPGGAGQWGPWLDAGAC